MPQNIDDILGKLDDARVGVVATYRLEQNDATNNDLEPICVEAVQRKLRTILGQDVDPDAPIAQYGLDSLSTVELTNWMSRYRPTKPTFMKDESVTCRTVVQHCS